MGEYHLNLMPTEEGYFGGGAYLVARDALKLGQLYLSHGVWNGRRLVNEAWVLRSTTEQAEMEPAFGVPHGYGYGWHLVTLKVGQKSYRAFNAGGNGGQLVLVVPELDLVLGLTGGSYGEFKKWYRWLTDLVPTAILPAVK